MRFAHALAAALCAVVASAQQNNAISIPSGQGTLDVTAGQPLTIQWTNPSSSTVTIKLQQDPITPDSGAVLASGIPASALTATVQIPPAEDVNSHVYTIEIIDDSNPNNINFSPNFGIQGATGTATGVVTGSVTSTASVSATTSGSSTDSSSLTSTGTDSSTITTTDSSTTSATSSASSSSSSSESSASSTSSQQTTSSTSSALPTETTSAPDSNSNGAGSVKVQGSLFAMAIGLIAVL
ncbi:uncharacterized protein Z520_05408 [Fonsecaea multimorphosa CBS 102226]|uniref:Uncharacterized protein n=1 Tax=Fonsecaea multimorphosa CBS 102226 TaxID=1442371 RepID=A0A0D2JZL8_9EURO|nr:uncharacterized protein Z520_05408 [Fonsecaea multimorphosa CBS 102226]KIX98947.1 hypothetical protein Z520_05408 [Fonsecaea multimorphosa CBS 102226]OAL25221.1 hypothetical protein AYO22_05098 [Fonsecaea multimorphosa]